MPSVEAVRAVERGEVAPVKDAATVVLLRDGDRGPEAHVVRRASSMAFAAGMQAFPGGSVDPGDLDEPLPWRGPDAVGLARRLSSTPDVARALVVAAVRETFEEAGVLLASRPGDDAVVVAGEGDEPWERVRTALEAHEVTLAAVLRERGLELRADLLHPWAHWITPELEPRRYDTRFFVAALPAGSAARHVGEEADARAWVRPDDALAALARREVVMLPPTSAVLSEVAPFGSVAEVLAVAPSRDFPVVMPRFAVVRTDAGEEEVRLVLPDGELAASRSDSGAS